MRSPARDNTTIGPRARAPSKAVAAAAHYRDDLFGARWIRAKTTCSKP
jgi:hypothetical protein